jgi:hypothetical protein
LITFKALNGQAPEYIKDLLEQYIPTRALRSSEDKTLLKLPHTKLKSYGDRSFSYAAPLLWNSLLLAIRESPTTETFKNRLKTYFF